MKVLYVLPKPGFFAEGPRGRVTHAMGVTNGLAENGVPILVMSGKGTKAQFSKLSSLIEVEQIEAKQRSFLSALAWTWKFSRRIRNVLQANEDITHVLVRYAVSNAVFFIPMMKRFPDRTWVFEVNSLAFHQLHWLTSAARRAYLMFEKWVLSHADLAYVVSSDLKDDIAQGQKALPEEKVIVIPNGGPESLADRVAPALADVPIRFLYLGLFHSYYELPLVIDAFREVRSQRSGVELHFYGDGANRSQLEHLANAIQDVSFHGKFELDSLLSRGAITENDVLILPYAPHGLGEIHSPIKLFEYMALGLPIIASAVGQIRDVLKDGRTAKFYTPGNRVTLTQAMMEVLENRQVRKRFIDNIRTEYSNRHTWKARMADLVSHLVPEESTNAHSSGRN
jgi:glycosyltransferase involved in cell wall biosynthesis